MYRRLLFLLLKRKCPRNTTHVTIAAAAAVAVAMIATIFALIPEKLVWIVACNDKVT